MKKYILLLALVLIAGVAGMHELTAAPPASVGNVNDEVGGTLMVGAAVGTGGSEQRVTLHDESAGTHYRLDITEDLLASVSPGERVHVVGTLNGNGLAVESIEGSGIQLNADDTETLSTQSLSTESLATAENHHILIIPGDWNDKTLLDDSDTCTPSGIKSRAETAAGWVGEASNGMQNLTFDVVPSPTEIEYQSWDYDYYEKWNNTDEYKWADTLDAGARGQGYEPNDYDSVLYVLPTTSGKSNSYVIVGTAEVGGKMWSFVCDSEHMVQDLNGTRNGFGFTYDFNEYYYDNDYSNAMFSTKPWSIHHTSFEYAGHHKLLKNWIPFLNLEEIPSGTSTYTLDAVDVAPGSNIQTLALPAYHPSNSVTNNKNFISYRVPSGLDVFSQFRNKVLIHESQMQYDSSSLKAVLGEGDVWYAGDDDGYSVVLAALHPGSADINVVDCELRNATGNVDPNNFLMRSSETQEVEVTVNNNNDRKCDDSDYDIRIVDSGHSTIEIQRRNFPMLLRPQKSGTGYLDVTTNGTPDGNYKLLFEVVDQYYQGLVRGAFEIDISVVTDTTPPAPPEGFKAEVNTKGKCKKNPCVDMEWFPSPEGDLDLYEVQRDGVPIGTTEDISFTDQPGSGDYEYSVKAVDTSGNASEPSNVETVNVP